ncbi:(deoxy)nucleoside triphosphate pyrophosphohydrolase [Sphingobacterium sp. SRCM116780]|uniref:(deoxy)nucleoside triphosphate pyrophosphohydrolase n=1 Tax=Sphingobacterium sp. SRCM116780 TaxID=2907623 RepID=UPI001F3A5785|nr:(deoxy)nucleoside triphosphate pyrophosphohydrolase [Sphingobacterium sp. SRCM116780]UIR57414.1 (deoxy)nucleoside triphosphate pyrophosphohydrolase [Sphingobacterium sp. SRCM116780]
MLQVTCAIIEHQGKVLICQRSAAMLLPLKWEFPGGKIEQGESMKACLAREIMEELNVTIQVEKGLSMVEHHYPDFSLCLHPFICTLISGDIQALEHAQTLWVDQTALLDYDWAEADLPIVREYLKLRP